MDTNTKRACRRCGEFIPYRATINGVEKNLQSRKFCLQCSPFGGHNTRPDDPTKPKSERNLPYHLWSDAKKEKWILLTTKRGHDLKKRLVEMKGGSCERCGYNQCLKALCFHHIDPTTKIFGLSGSNLRAKKWEEVLAEAQKCQLLCANCHNEIHDV